MPVVNEETRTGKAYAEEYGPHLAPSIYTNNIKGTTPGKYAVTMRNGKVARIVWEADE